MPDDPTAVEPFRPTPEQFDEFIRISTARSLVALFDQALGPFPPHVEPFSFVTREGLERVFAELRLEPEDHLVDLCCGRGGIGLWFARESGARLTGIDFSPFAVAEARRRAGLFVADGQASFVVADMTETSLERQSADAVVCIDSLQHASDGEVALREAGSLLRGDGRIVLTTIELDETPPGRTPVTDVARLAEAAGLQVVLREEHQEWLEGHRALYENVIAADGEDAEQAIRWMADEARAVLPRIADARRVLLVAACRTQSGLSSPRSAVPGVAKLYTDDADLYDIAFDWDIKGEVRWLLERLGPRCRRVLEPGCGSGRMLDAFASRGLEMVGFDSSPTMVALARERLAGRAVVHLADMTDFDLDRTFEGAVCPINTLCHLTRAELTRHLEAMARHLEPGACYLVQVGLADPERRAPLASSHWEASRRDTHLRIEWVEEELDVVGGRSRQRSRIHVLSGPRAGEVIEELHDMTAWTPSTWRSAIKRSPFTVIATYDGGEEARPRVEATALGGLLWHELRRDG